MREINRDFKILIILSKRWIEELSQFCNSCLIISLGDPVKSTTQGINDRYFMWNPLCSRIMWIIGLLHVLIGPNMWYTLKFVLPQFYGKLCRSSNCLNSPLLLLKIKIVGFFTSRKWGFILFHRWVSPGPSLFVIPRVWVWRCHLQTHWTGFKMSPLPSQIRKQPKSTW